MSYVFRTLIVTAAEVDLAREVAASFGPGNENMWTTALSGDGNDPATHYISSGYVPVEYEIMVPWKEYSLDEQGNWVVTASHPGDPVAVYQNAIDNGVQCTQAEIDQLFATSDVTDQDPFVAMGRLGVQIIRKPLTE